MTRARRKADDRAGSCSSECSRRRAGGSRDSATAAVARPGPTVPWSRFVRRDRPCRDRSQRSARGREESYPPEEFDPKADYTSHSQFSIESDSPNHSLPARALAKHDGSMRLGQAVVGLRRGARVPPQVVSASGSATARSGRDDPRRRRAAGRISIELTYTRRSIHGRALSPDRVAFATKQFTIPEIPGGRSDEPFDLGVLRPAPRRTPSAGEPARCEAVTASQERRPGTAATAGKVDDLSRPPGYPVTDCLGALRPCAIAIRLSKRPDSAWIELSLEPELAAGLHSGRDRSRLDGCQPDLAVHRVGPGDRAARRVDGRRDRGAGRVPGADARAGCSTRRWATRLRSSSACSRCTGA